MSNELKEFYRAYKAWLDAGAPDSYFSKHSGLCSNLINWFMACKFGHSRKDMYNLDKEMSKQFTDAGLHRGYPFGERDYYRDYKRDTQHLNPLRIKWVEEHCK